MNLSNPKGPDPDYIVGFNPEIGWTLAYEDAVGKLIFFFEVEQNPKLVLLDMAPLENHRPVVACDGETRARLDLAFERTKAYLVSCGYEVTSH